jgi:hypothetical protein
MGPTLSRVEGLVDVGKQWKLNLYICASPSTANKPAVALALSRYESDVSDQLHAAAAPSACDHAFLTGVSLIFRAVER